MGYNADHYKMDEDGYVSQAEAERAEANGHLERLSNGNLYDRQTGEEFWADGTKKASN